MTDALPPLPEPVAWTLGAELDARKTTCGAHLWFVDPVNSALAPLHTADQMRSYAATAVAAEREACAKPTEAMELAGMRALRNTHRTVSGEYSREQARACWDAMVRAIKP